MINENDRAAVTLIQTETCARFEISFAKMLGPSRRKAVVAARYEAIRAAREKTKLSTPKLGALFNRDHTSILWALGRLKKSSRPKAVVGQDGKENP